MDIDTVETKVQVRLSTRDPNLQISEEPTTLLVQTCKSSFVISVYRFAKEAQPRIIFDNRIHYVTPKVFVIVQISISKKVFTNVVRQP